MEEKNPRARLDPAARAYPYRVVTLLDQDDAQALDRLIAAEKLPQADLLRRLIRQADKALGKSSAA